MRNVLVIGVFLFAITFGIAVNAPRQILLFCHPENLVGIPEEVVPIIERAVFSGFDTETNVADIDSRFSCQMYLNEPILKIEFFVMASRILGIEKEVLENYPLMSPTFNDVKTALEKRYTDSSYDFSRDFGYVEYVQEYMKEKYGYPLVDGDFDPLDQMTKLEVLKGIVRLFAAVSKDRGWDLGKDIYEWAESLSKKLVGHPGSGIEDVEDVGYISVFEKMFLLNDGKKLFSLIKYPPFSGEELMPNDPAPRWWAISLMYYVFEGEARPVGDEELIPIRYPNNLVVYVPKKTVDYNPVELILKPGKKLQLNDMKVKTGKFPVALLKGDNGEVVVLDNTLVEEDITYEGKSSQRRETKVLNGGDFVKEFIGLPDETVFDERTCVVKLTVEKLDTELKVLSVSPLSSECSDDMLREVPKTIGISDIGGNVEVTVNEISVGTVEEMKKILVNYDELKRRTVSSTKMKLKDLLPHMIIDLNVVIKRRTVEKDLTKADFRRAVIQYLPVRDRLNLSSDSATFGSLKEFVGTFNSPHEFVSRSDKPDFIDYWQSVSRNLEDLKASDNAEIAGKMTVYVKKNISAPYTYEKTYEPFSVVLWKFFVGKIISHEPATKRIMTQKYVEPLEYFDDTWIYVEFKDGRVVKDKKMIEVPNIFYDSRGVLKDFMLWYQLVKEDGTIKIKYIIAKEL